MTEILLADDEIEFRASAAEVLREKGYRVTEVGSTREGVATVRARSFDVVLADLRMPGGSGMELLRAAAERFPDCILIVLTAYGSFESALDALRLGAHDFLLKPIDLEALVRKVEIFVRHQSTLAENRFLRGRMEQETPVAGLVGPSAAMERVRSFVARLGAVDATVLVRGETGTGKELVAVGIHRAGPRKALPFVAVNCGSIPEGLLESELFGHVRGAFTGADRDKRGLFEVAGAGTVFLDEAGELPQSLQPKLLRALEAREVLRVGSTSPTPFSARVIAATNRDLARMVAEGRFRADLYYRLNVVEVVLPPLRERPEDVAPLAEHLIERIARRMNVPRPVIEPDALLVLERYAWPGNVRELANVLERAVILGGSARILVEDLPGLGEAPPGGREDDLRTARAAFERALARRVLLKYGGDKRRAAEALGIDLSSLYRKLGEPEPSE